MTDEVEGKQPFDGSTDDTEERSVIERSGERYSITAERTSDLAVFRCSGEFDMNNHGAAELEEVAVELFEARVQNFLIDVRPATFVDSTYLGMMVRLLKRIQPAGGKVSLIAGDNQNVRSIFALTGLDKVFDLFDDEDTARAELRL